MIFVKADYMNAAAFRFVLRRSFIDPVGKTTPALTYARTGLVTVDCVYVERTDTGKVERCELTFRELAEFKIARARGDFKKIGVV